MNNRPWQQFHFAAGSPNPGHATGPINSAGSGGGDPGREGPPLLSAEGHDGQQDLDPRLDRGNPGVILEAAAGVDSLQLYLQVQNIDNRLSTLEAHVYNNLQPRLQEALAEAASVTGEPTAVSRVGRRPLSSLPGRAPTVSQCCLYCVCLCSVVTWIEHACPCWR